MKRAALFSLFLSAVLTVASGIFSAASDVPWAGHVHVAIGVVFMLMIAGHVRQSFKASRRAA